MDSPALLPSPTLTAGSVDERRFGMMARSPSLDETHELLPTSSSSPSSSPSSSCFFRCRTYTQPGSIDRSYTDTGSGPRNGIGGSISGMCTG